MIILRPKNIILGRFWPLSKFHFPACSTLPMYAILSLFVFYCVQCVRGQRSCLPVSWTHGAILDCISSLSYFFNVIIDYLLLDGLTFSLSISGNASFPHKDNRVHSRACLETGRPACHFTRRGPGWQCASPS